MALDRDIRALTSRLRCYSPGNASSTDADARFTTALQQLRAGMSTSDVAPRSNPSLEAELVTLRGRITALESERQRSERTISDLRRHASVIEKERDSLRDKVAALAVREREVEQMRRELLARHAALLDQERNLAVITAEQKRRLRDHFSQLAKGA